MLHNVLRLAHSAKRAMLNPAKRAIPALTVLEQDTELQFRLLEFSREGVTAKTGANAEAVDGGVTRRNHDAAKEGIARHTVLEDGPSADKQEHKSAGYGDSVANPEASGLVNELIYGSSLSAGDVGRGGYDEVGLAEEGDDHIFVKGLHLIHQVVNGVGRASINEARFRNVGFGDLEVGVAADGAAEKVAEERAHSMVCGCQFVQWDIFGRAYKVAGGCEDGLALVRGPLSSELHRGIDDWGDEGAV